MSHETTTSTTKAKAAQIKSAQTQTESPVQDMLGVGLDSHQLAMHNGSMAGQAALLNRLHPAQRTAMVQRMTRTHGNDHIG